MNDFLEEQPTDYIEANLMKLSVFKNEERSFMIRTYIKYYMKNHTKWDNLINVVNRMFPNHMEDINRLLILK